jgi:hypothetical protein
VKAVLDVGGDHTHGDSPKGQNLLPVLGNCGERRRRLLTQKKAEWADNNPSSPWGWLATAGTSIHKGLALPIGLVPLEHGRTHTGIGQPWQRRLEAER